MGESELWRDIRVTRIDQFPKGREVQRVRKEIKDNQSRTSIVSLERIVN